MQFLKDKWSQYSAGSKIKKFWNEYKSIATMYLLNNKKKLL